MYFSKRNENRAWSQVRAGSIAQMYHDRDTFDFSQGHETKNQPTAVPAAGIARSIFNSSGGF